MATPLKPTLSQYRQRTLITGIAATSSASSSSSSRTICTTNFSARFGLGDRSIDTLMTLSVCCSSSPCSTVSRLLYHDAHMGIDEQLKDERQRCPSNKVCQRVAMPELREIPRFNKVLVGQLRSVVEQTEQAAYDVTSRLQTIDEVVTDLNRFVAGAAAESESDGARFGGNDRRQLPPDREARRPSSPSASRKTARTRRAAPTRSGKRRRCRPWST
jgi:hypothetical protein